jgi:hypothetical protein
VARERAPERFSDDEADDREIGRQARQPGIAQPQLNAPFTIREIAPG